ncbi:MAG: hypothetical protein M3460_28620, partial [Actinomycetota bacterium]|nr:hypothetical protein [Actinomycetota bacterium]
MDTIRLAVTAATVRQLQQWAARWPQRRWAVEGAEGLGRGVAQGLAAAGGHRQLAEVVWWYGRGWIGRVDLRSGAQAAAVAVPVTSFQVVN